MSIAPDKSHADVSVSAEDALCRIVEGTGATTGQDFFRSLVRHLAGALGVRWAFVGELVREADPGAGTNGVGRTTAAERVRTLAVWEGMNFVDNFEYRLAGTPCEGVVTRGVCDHPRGVAVEFPDDRLLADQAVEAYLGMPLFDTSGEVLGLLVVMHDRPVDGGPGSAPAVPQTHGILRLFAGRAAAELQRLRREDQLRAAYASLEQAHGSLADAHAQLRDAERRHRDRADASPIGLFHADAAGNCVYVNAQCARMIGVGPDEALGWGWARHLHADDRTRVMAAARRTIDEHVPFRSEHRFVHPGASPGGGAGGPGGASGIAGGGAVVWVLAEILPERDGDGRVVGFVGTVADITERQGIERDLRTSETRLRVIASQMPAVLWTTDADLVVTSGMGAGHKDLGISPDHFTGTSLYNLESDPAWRDSPVMLAHRRALLGESVAYEQKWRNRWYQCHVEPLRETGGKVTGTIGVGLDVTDRKQAEQALRDAKDWLEFRVQERTDELRQANESLVREIERRNAIEEDLRQSQARYASILNSQQTLIARSDLRGRITYVNAAHQRTFGSKVGDAVFIKVHPDDVAETERAMADLAKPPYYCSVEQRCEVRGQWQVFLWQAAAIRDRTGTIIEYQAVGFDITGRRHAEELVRESERRARENEQRAKENEERAREAARKAHEALEEARQVAEFNRRLALEVDHRVRNNLFGLLGLVSAMKAGAGGRDVRAFASAVEGRLLAMTHVHQLLADTNWQPIGLRVLVTGLLGAVKQLGCEDIPATVDGPPVMVSARQAPPLAMILQEWFTNSCKYGAHSSPAGNLMVVWSVDRSATPPRARVYWTETGGPPIRSDVKPSLGTQLVKSFANRELRGRVELKFPEDGADHVLDFPLELPGA